MGFRVGDRIDRVLARCSRERWLSPKEVRGIAAKMGKKVYVSQVEARRYLDRLDVALAVGLFKGEPPFVPGSPVYGDFLYCVEQKRPKARHFGMELEILKLRVKEMKCR